MNESMYEVVGQGHVPSIETETEILKRIRELAADYAASDPDGNYDVILRGDCIYIGDELIARRIANAVGGLDVIVKRIVTRPMFQVFTSRVVLNGADKLTPKTARAAINVAFGGGSGEVWVTDSDGNPLYGYRVYEHSARKLHPQW